MALEWSTDINFAGLFKRKPRVKQEYPSKTYINLIVPDEHEIRGMRIAVSGVVGAIFIALFAKFGVYDFFARVMAKSNELAERTDTLNNITWQLVDYDDVAETYRTYEAARITDEAGDIAAVDVLDLTDQYIAPMANINSLKLNDNVLFVTLTDIDLDKVGELVSNLYQEKTVTGVQVTTASSGSKVNDDTKTVLLTISLQSAAAANAEEVANAQKVSNTQTSSTAQGD